MAAVVKTTGIVLTLFAYFINGQNLKSTVVFSPSELIGDSYLVNNSLKLALRYGFQQTAKCRDFSKAFICVQKCLDLGFDIARSDRNCFCTCFHKRGKAKKTTRNLSTKTKWRLGAPTTKLPIWAVTRKEEQKLKHNDTVIPDYVLVDGNLSNLVTGDQTENPTGETETAGTGDIGNTTDVTGEINTGQDAENATNATGAAENMSGQTGGTDKPKDAVTGTGKADAGTGTGKADAGTQAPGNSTGGTNGPSGAPNTGGTGNAATGTKPNAAPTGGTDKPKEEGKATTVA